MSTPKVEIISATERPVDVISLAAGICYGKSDVSEKRIRHCFKSGHLSVFEHASITFKAEGISRACMAQLTRHRLVSFCVESQRYNKYDLSGNDWYVMPPTFEKDANWEVSFRISMDDAQSEYSRALGWGMKPEDARYLLPEATKTNLIMTCNVRQLFHIFDMRMDKAAQWEIRRLASALFLAASGLSDQWRYIMDLYGGKA